MISQSLAQISTDLPAFERRYQSPISIFADDFKQPHSPAPRDLSPSTLALLLRNTDQYLQILESQRAGLAHLRALLAETIPLLRPDACAPLKRMASAPLPALEAPNLSSGGVGRELAGFLSTPDCFDNMSDLTRASFHSVEALVERLERLQAQIAPRAVPIASSAAAGVIPSAAMANHTTGISVGFKASFPVGLPLPTVTVMAGETKLRRPENGEPKFSVRTENALKAELGGPKAESDDGRYLAEKAVGAKMKAARADAEKSVADAVEAEERLMKPILDFKKNGGSGDEARNEGFVQRI